MSSITSKKICNSSKHVSTAVISFIKVGVNLEIFKNRKCGNF